MADEAGGTGPRRGLRYQNLAAAYFFLAESSIFPYEPDRLYIERYDSDFAFQLETDDGHHRHFFEVKHIKRGELKWGNKFKSEVVPEFYRISQKHATHGGMDTSYYHLVTNGAVAGRVGEIADDAKSLRRGSSWPVLKKKKERDEFAKLMSGIESNKTVKNDNEVDPPEDVDDLYQIIWGLEVHRPAEELLEEKLKKYLKSCSPANFRAPMERIINEISSKDSGIIRRKHLEEVAGISLDGGSSSTTPADGRSNTQLVERGREISNSLSSTTPDTPKIRQQREDIRELGNRASQDGSASNSAVSSASEIADSQFDRLEQIEMERTSTMAQIQQQIDILVDEMDTSNAEPQNYD